MSAGGSKERGGSVFMSDWGSDATSTSICPPGCPSIRLASARNPPELKCCSTTINSPDELLCGWRHQCWLLPHNEFGAD